MIPPLVCNSALSIDIVSTSLDFFWENWTDVTVDPQSQSGFPELLRPLYERLPLDSPLQLATSALAVNVTYSALGRPLESDLPSSLLSKALLATKSIINDPVQSLTDETLASVLILGACEALKQAAESHPPSGVHKFGALALVRARGPLNFKSELARRLLVAVRHHTIRWALTTGEKVPVEPVLWLNDDTMLKNSVTILETCAIRLANLRANVAFM